MEMTDDTFKIKLPRFEGPFDLLLFFIERDELDIYDIPIARITDDFLVYIHRMESLNIELASDFILFISTLMRIKARMLIPRKEIDDQGNEIDPRQELIDKILEYKRFKQAAEAMATLEAERLLLVRRGNIRQELYAIGELSGEGTEIQTLTMFRIMKTFEKVMQRMQDRENKPQHVVFKYEYTMEGSKQYLTELASRERTLPFEKVFERCKDRIHAIFLFLSLLELIQEKSLSILLGSGRNNFILEYAGPPQTSSLTHEE
ncbi:MAG TPA: segregation/condensation protein A [Chitinophagaceae bacterium]|nr:segregation/condensation protein A [Chitinophagaceae bacterium]